MQLIHWLSTRAFGGSKKLKSQHRQPRPCRLRVEPLEDRLVLSTVTGVYNLGPGTDGNLATRNANGSFSLVASQANTFSYVNYDPNQIFAFGQLNTLSAVFTSIAGGSGGGSPRIKIGLDDNGTEKYLLIYLGAGPSYVNTSAVLNTFSGTNLVGAGEPEAYDTSAFAGGTPFTTYASADALIGALNVVEIDFVADTFSPYANRNVTFKGFSAAIPDALPFADQFNSGSTLSNSWFTEAGQYVTTTGQAVGHAAFNLAVANGINVGDVSVQAAINFTAPSQYVGLVGRYSGPGDNNEYIGTLAWLGGANYRATISRISAGTATLLASANLTSGTGTLLFDLEGPSLKLFLNGALIVYAQDSVLATGTVGMRSSAGAGVSDFAANAIVQPVTPVSFSDDFTPDPPGNQLSANWLEQAGNYNVATGAAVAQGAFNLATLTNLAAANVAVQANISFTANNQYIGLVARYSGPRDNNEYFASITRLSPTSYQASIVRIVKGVPTTLATDHLTNGTGTLLFELAGPSLKVFLNNTLVAYAQDTALTSGSVGMRTAKGTSVADFSVAPITLTTPVLPFSDTFSTSVNNQLSSNWVEQAGNYSVATGAAVAQGAFNLATLTNLAAANVAVQANISFTANNQYIGLVARYSGPRDNNEYFASITRLSPTSYQVAIVRIVNGVPTTLAADHLTNGTGTLLFELAGPSLKVFLNNTLVAYAQDTALTSGSVGMRTAKGTSVADFAVAAITLTTPALPFSDTFSTSVNNQLSSNWVEEAGNYKVTPGTGATGQASLNEAVLNGVSAANVTLQADVSLAVGAYFGLVGRYTGPGDANTYLANVVRLANGTYQANLYKNVKGTWIKIGPTATRATFAGDLEFILNGATLTLDMDGTTAVSITDASITGAATVGMRSGAGATVSSFSAM
jgi:hypothetical protein